MSNLTKPMIQKDSKASAALMFAEEASKVVSKAEKAPPVNRRNPYAPIGHRRLTINLPEELHKKLRLAAIDRDCTATDIIEDMLKKELGV
jgi:hypothetical protein